MATTVFSHYRDWLLREPMPAGRRAALVTAMALFAKQGYEETSTVTIAKAAGISQATIFKYFHTKQDLLIAIVKPAMTHFFPKYRDDFFKGIRQCLTLTELVQFIVTDRYQFVQANVEAIKIMAREMMINAEVRRLFGEQIMNHDFNFLTELMTNFQRTGELRDDIDAGGLVRIIGGQLMMYIIQGNYAPMMVHDADVDLAVMTTQIVRSLAR